MADETNEEGAVKSGGGLMSVLPIALIAAAATFGMVWMAAAPSETSADCEALVNAAHEEVDLAEMQARAAEYVTLEPLTVTLGPDAGAKHLMVTIALGVPADGEQLTDVQFLRLRDRFLERLRTVDTAILTDPRAMPTLKQSLLAQAQTTLGRDAVQSVLITEFLMK